MSDKYVFQAKPLRGGQDWGDVPEAFVKQALNAFAPEADLDVSLAALRAGVEHRDRDYRFRALPVVDPALLLEKVLTAAELALELAGLVDTIVIEEDPDQIGDGCIQFETYGAFVQLLWDPEEAEPVLFDVGLPTVEHGGYWDPPDYDIEFKAQGISAREVPAAVSSALVETALAIRAEAEAEEALALELEEADRYAEAMREAAEERSLEEYDFTADDLAFDADREKRGNRKLGP